jgi:hypothetical protein
MRIYAYIGALVEKRCLCMHIYTYGIYTRKVYMATLIMYLVVVYLCTYTPYVHARRYVCVYLCYAPWLLPTPCTIRIGP